MSNLTVDQLYSLCKGRGRGKQVLCKNLTVHAIQYGSEGGFHRVTHGILTEAKYFFVARHAEDNRLILVSNHLSADMILWYDEKGPSQENYKGDFKLIGVFDWPIDN